MPGTVKPGSRDVDHIDLLIRLVDSTLESCDNRPLERDLVKARGWLNRQKYPAQPRKQGSR